MTSGNAPRRAWEMVCASAMGASHVRSELPNQDAIDCKRFDENGGVAVAVSDGHGSQRYFRSEVGSRFAVEVALEVLRELDKTGLQNLKDTETELPKFIVRRWRDKVSGHCRENPFSQSEFLKMDDKTLLAHVREGKTDFTAYGATLLGALMAKDFVLFFQLGDGEILAIGSDFSVQHPLPEDASLLGNETTSLCAKDPEKEFRVKIYRYETMNPALVLLTTDGYPNCFTDEPEFLKLGQDILEIAHNDGIPSVREQIEEWCRQSSGQGSGDDISLGLIFGDVENAAWPEPIALKTPSDATPESTIEPVETEKSLPKAESPCSSVAVGATQEDLVMTEEKTISPEELDVKSQVMERPVLSDEEKEMRK